MMSRIGGPQQGRWDTNWGFDILSRKPERQGWKRLEILNAATGLEDLRALPGNRLEALYGDREGQFSIRINLQWRICFEWPDGQPGPSNVEIVDYH